MLYLGSMCIHRKCRKNRQSKTLNDFEQLLGNINLLCLSLCIPTQQLHNLLMTLQGDTSLESKREVPLE